MTARAAHASFISECRRRREHSGSSTDALSINRQSCPQRVLSLLVSHSRRGSTRLRPTSDAPHDRSRCRFNGPMFHFPHLVAGVAP